MDEKYQYTDPGYGRSAEEIAWDEEFNNTRTSRSVGNTIGELGRMTAQAPGAIASMTASMFPQDTRRHARAAVREGFLAVRSLLGAIGDSIEEALADRDDTPGSARTPLGVSGPAGTWGTAASTGGSTAPGTGGARARKIEIADTDLSGISTTSISETTEEEDDAPDERGLRADIDY